MTNYREILRLRSLGINHSQIAESMAISRPTVITVLQRAVAQELDWRAAEGLSDRELSARLFPQGEGKPVYIARSRPPCMTKPPMAEPIFLMPSTMKEMVIRSFQQVIHSV